MKRNKLLGVFVILCLGVGVLCVSQAAENTTTVLGLPDGFAWTHGLVSKCLGTRFGVAEEIPGQLRLTAAKLLAQAGQSDQMIVMVWESTRKEEGYRLLTQVELTVTDKWSPVSFDEPIVLKPGHWYVIATYPTLERSCLAANKREGRYNKELGWLVGADVVHVLIPEGLDSLTIAAGFPDYTIAVDGVLAWID